MSNSLSSVSYPLSLTFKFFALSPQIFIKDSTGREIVFVHQKLFKFKEDVRVYKDSSKQEEIFRINADRIIDFSAQYHFSDSKTSQTLGSVAQKGWKSLWSATYYILDNQKQTTHIVVEDNPLAKVMNYIMEQIPFLGFVSGYFFHPSYTVYQGSDRNSKTKAVMQLKKVPSFTERRFEINKLDQGLAPEIETTLLLSLLMVVQLEKHRG